MQRIYDVIRFAVDHEESLAGHKRVGYIIGQEAGDDDRRREARSSETGQRTALREADEHGVAVRGGPGVPGEAFEAFEQTGGGRCGITRLRLPPSQVTLARKHRTARQGDLAARSFGQDGRQVEQLLRPGAVAMQQHSEAGGVLRGRFDEKHVAYPGKPS